MHFCHWSQVDVKSGKAQISWHIIVPPNHTTQNSSWYCVGKPEMLPIALWQSIQEGGSLFHGLYVVLVCPTGSFNCLERYISACQRTFVVYIFVGFLKGIWDHASLHACSEFINMCIWTDWHVWFLLECQGVMEYHSELAAYFKQKGVSVILLLRRNSLKRMISILANAYDKKEKLLNGTHKSHVHSKEEVPFPLSCRW
jgi:hypothetical protein